MTKHLMQVPNNHQAKCSIWAQGADMRLPSELNLNIVFTGLGDKDTDEGRHGFQHSVRMPWCADYCDALHD
nr:hypothetical protein [Microvirga thermotolerans]